MNGPPTPHLPPQRPPGLMGHNPSIDQLMQSLMGQPGGAPPGLMDSLSLPTGLPQMPGLPMGGAPASPAAGGAPGGGMLGLLQMLGQGRNPQAMQMPQDSRLPPTPLYAMGGR